MYDNPLSKKPVSEIGATVKDALLAVVRARQIADPAAKDRLLEQVIVVLRTLLPRHAGVGYYSVAELGQVYRLAGRDEEADLLLADLCNMVDARA